MIERGTIATCPLHHRGEASENQPALERGALCARDHECLHGEEYAEHQAGE
jgi:hypothetical protein